jgi:putative DNA primase/helicase
MQDDDDKAQFMQKALGYALTGDTSEECFFIFYGNTTRNGKGTTAETILNILGDYGCTAQPETIAQKQNSSSGAPSEDVARLKGARFVNMSEPDKGLRLNSALVKSMTGGDTITARFLHQNSFEFKPEYKLFINTNHLPRVNDDSIFASGRVKLIPFERHFPENEQDKGLKAFFRQPENKTGILNWLVAGLRLLKADGLKQPKSVREATAQYREDSDIIGQFINECLVEVRYTNTPLKNIHARYEEWCEDYGHRPLNSRNLAAELRRKGKIVDRGTENKMCLIDHGILADSEDLPTEWK